MSVSGGSEQSIPTLPPNEQIMAQAKQHLRNEPPAAPNFPNLSPAIENLPAQPSAPASNVYRETQPLNNSPHMTINTEELNDRPTNPEEGYKSNLDAIRALQGVAEGFAGAGDLKTAKQITDGLLDGTLKRGLDNPPSIDDIRAALDPNNWKKMNLAQRAVVALLKK